MEWDNPHVIYEKKGQIAYLTMNRPERMNALGRYKQGPAAGSHRLPKRP